jgi:asparagine synthase (glutamine-hydrolysing)
MCGIAGYIQRAPHDEDTILRMVARMAHRGPDGAGVWCSAWNGWHVALGHCRLAIVDPRRGRQPMHDAERDVHLTYNGEVYGYADLRRALASKGHGFRTTSDTEVVLHHLSEGADEVALRALDGMFALGFWDGRSGRLLLARDRAGIKPLYFALLADGGIAFASELTALLEHSGVSRSIDPEALASYLFMDYCMAPGCIIQGVQKLEPAGSVTWDAGRISVPRTYWQAGMGAISPPRGRRDRVELLRRRLDEAVESRLVADVPVGLLLSGGLDSSLVGALAARRVQGTFKTFSVRLDDPEFDQSSYARLMSAHIGSEHVEEYLPASGLLRTLDQALDCLDEPLADPSLLPTFALSRLAADHVKVVLSGDGADELWGGYPTVKAHAVARAYGLLPASLRRGLIEPLARRLPVRDGYQSLDWKIKRFALHWDDQPLIRQLRWMSSVDLDQLASAGLAGTLPAAFAPCSRVAPTGDLINDILRLDFATYLPGAVLAKVDRASMAHGLEVRPPLLSNDLIDLALALPSSVKARGNGTKLLLRASAEGIVPQQVLGRSKMGFPIPLARWLRGPLTARLDAALGNGGLWDTGLLERSTFVRWRDEHLARREDHARPLWGIIVLEHWWRRMFGSRPAPLRAVTKVREQVVDATPARPTMNESVARA